MINARPFLSRALNSYALCGGLRDTGMLAEREVFSEGKILQQYVNLDFEDQEWLVSKLPIFYVLCDQCGLCSRRNI